MDDNFVSSLISLHTEDPSVARIYVNVTTKSKKVKSKVIPVTGCGGL
jgi:hypothetical protein